MLFSVPFLPEEIESDDEFDITENGVVATKNDEGIGPLLSQRACTLSKRKSLSASEAFDCVE